MSKINKLKNKYEYSVAPDSQKITMNVQNGDSISCFLEAYGKENGYIGSDAKINKEQWNDTFKELEGKVKNLNKIKVGQKINFSKSEMELLMAKLNGKEKETKNPAEAIPEVKPAEVRLETTVKEKPTQVITIETTKEKPQTVKKETTDEKSLILSKYKNSTPKQWGEKPAGVVTSLKTKEKVIALTFDACGSKGDSYDKKLIDFLTENKIPATLFLNSRWIDKNPKIAKELAQNPLFEIENHGSQHKPLSVNGKSAYGIKGTQNTSEVYDEVENNSKKIQQLSGHRPKFFRPGTAYCDDIGVKIAEDLGQKIAGYNLLGDAGATFSKAQIEKQLTNAKPGTIALFHMNKPNGQTAEALTEVLPKLKSQGFKFVRLDQVETK